ncbi:hypothetical protein, partial [Escherichia coli]|uniref:hypothetical protein n=1 Tax=Escherichia coli TaxID=562 RepID=UPI001BDD979C
RLETLLGTLRARVPKDDIDKNGIDISIRDTQNQLARLNDFFLKNNVKVMKNDPTTALLAKLTQGVRHV